MATIEAGKTPEAQESHRKQALPTICALDQDRLMEPQLHVRLQRIAL